MVGTGFRHGTCSYSAGRGLSKSHARWLGEQFIRNAGHEGCDMIEHVAVLSEALEICDPETAELNGAGDE